MNRTKLIAGVGGVALIAGIAGMSTFALWSDNASVPGGTVTAGTLQVAEVDTYWTDVSPDVAERGIADIATYELVPGDVVQLTSEVDVALEGANLAANLDISTLEQGVIEAGAEDYVDISVQLYDGTGAPFNVDTNGNYRFSASDAYENLGGIQVPATLDDAADVTAEVTITFDAATPDQVLTGLDLASFADSGVELTQVREGQGFVEEVTP